MSILFNCLRLLYSMKCPKNYNLFGNFLFPTDTLMQKTINISFLFKKSKYKKKEIIYIFRNKLSEIHSLHLKRSCNKYF